MVGCAPPVGCSAELEPVCSASSTAISPTRTNRRHGLDGAIDDYALVNLVLDDGVPGTEWMVFGSIENVFDKEYSADRARGILPGARPPYQAGVPYRF